MKPSLAPARSRLLLWLKEMQLTATGNGDRGREHWENNTNSHTHTHTHPHTHVHQWWIKILYKGGIKQLKLKNSRGAKLYLGVQ